MRRRPYVPRVHWQHLDDAGTTRASCGLSGFVTFDMGAVTCKTCKHRLGLSSTWAQRRAYKR